MLEEQQESPSGCRGEMEGKSGSQHIGLLALKHAYVCSCEFILACIHITHSFKCARFAFHMPTLFSCVEHT